MPNWRNFGRLEKPKIQVVNTDIAGRCPVGYGSWHQFWSSYDPRDWICMQCYPGVSLQESGLTHSYMYSTDGLCNYDTIVCGLSRTQGPQLPRAIFVRTDHEDND